MIPTGNNKDLSSTQLDKKLESILMQNNNLKDQLGFLCKRIEENIYKSKIKSNENTTEDFNYGEDYMPIHQRIVKYKDQMANMKAKMEGFYNLRKLEGIENEIKSKKDILNNLKYENNVLNNIHKNQTKAKAQYEQKFENKNEIKILQEKLRLLKEEYKYSKDMQKTTDIKLKNQNTTINSLEEKCSKIKENIEFKKRSATAPGKTDNFSNEDDLEEKVRFIELQISNEEKNYKNEIMKQQGIINRISEELSLLNIQLKEKEQEIRINELKLKELKKINTHNQELIKGVVGRNKSNDGRAISAKNKNINDRSKSKPHFSNTPSSIRNNRPFNIKFENKVNTNYNNNYNQYNLPNERLETKGDNKDKEDMLNQIENLSNLEIKFLENELKNALRYNDKIFKKELETDICDNQVFANNYKEQSSILSNKDLFDKIDKIELENKENLIPEEKRKPFKPFIFDKNFD